MGKTSPAVRGTLIPIIHGRERRPSAPTPPRKALASVYVGELKAGAVRFKNFEFEATVRSEKESNSGIYFHSTSIRQGRSLHFEQGLRGAAQITRHARKKRPEPLRDCPIFDKSPVERTPMFKIRFRVEKQTHHDLGQ